MKRLSSIIVLVLICFFVLFFFIANVHYNNKDVELRNLYTAQYDVVEGYYDNMWKIIAQQAEVTENYKESFKDIYIGIMEGRYSNEGRGSLSSWIHEANPSFDSGLFQKLMNSIEVQRKAFLKEQEKMLNIINQHNNLIATIPGKWFVSNKDKLEYTMITSTRAREVRETGLDDDIKVF